MSDFCLLLRNVQAHAVKRAGKVADFIGTAGVLHGHAVFTL